MEPVLRNIDSVDWITIVLIISLMLMVAAKSIFYTRFLNFIILPFNDKYIFMYNKKEKLANWFHVFFTVFQVINFSLFIFLAIKILHGSKDSSTINGYFYALITGFLLLFFLLKVFLQLANGFIFSSTKTINDILFKKLSYLNYSSIIIFLMNVILTYVFKDSKTMVYITFLLILIINGIGWATLLRNHQKTIASNFFYFILYLCALEIAPFVIIGSYLND